ncbi:hypothetical protein MUK42_14681 [Musa troglodytarum]|uniref:Myb/SANT-like DNA-binding domain-containing protein n=1 Tax=Musa troglodytarum TaxID=320322 RepID=A0A9E7IBS4_9LILI|nr:hypothetical protein MUK42_14681 [Musa troglodytarum]
MKWTDGMVRLLIQVVYHVGDDGGGAEGEQQQPHGTVAKVSALLQKKGKWKSVSGAMMEKGFYVSPQQCEDKFNDLNKRYKRVNDLLGKGTACRVRQWLKRKAAELEEQRVAYQCRAFQLERQHFKWLRFSTNKEREMERMKLDNERLCLENDRMLLLLRQTELELAHGGSGGGGSSAAVPYAEQQLMLQNTNTNTNQRRPAEQPHIPNADHASATA